MAHHNKFHSVNPHSRSTAGNCGMATLSRPRAPPRLAVPPPLNLPSLRKEHERSDPSAPSRKDPTSGIGPNSSSMRWNKPDRVVGAGNELSGINRSVGEKLSSYVPPEFVAPEKAEMLRGEEFPSLRATVVSEKVKQAKVKEGFSQKQEEPVERQESRVSFSMRPHMKSALVDSGSKENGGVAVGAALKLAEKFSSSSLSGPLPVVKLQHTSDWADDERDTTLSLPERERGRGYSSSGFAQLEEVYGGRGAVDAEDRIVRNREFYKGDSFGRDVKGMNGDGRDSGSWRSPLHSQLRDGFNIRDSRDTANDARPLGANRETAREGMASKVFGNGGRDGLVGANEGSQYAKTDLGSPMKTLNGRGEAFSSRFSEKNSRGRYGENSNKWYKECSIQSSTMTKGPSYTGTRGGSSSDPFLNVGREKQTSSSCDKPYVEESVFDSNDPFSDGIRDVNLKMFKRKKDIVKQDDFHDPVRESFEAELESILRAQEQDRQRVTEEQARALEYARKEEKERHRLAREEDERRRLLEEKARNSAWRAELDKLDAARRAEEQRIAIEDEKKRYQMEDERRKEAANQKLLELETKIARRQEEKVKDDMFISSTLNNDQITILMNERATPRTAEIRDWEDNERMVERVTSSALSESSSMNKCFEGGSRPQSSRDLSAPSVDRGKYSYYNSPFLQGQDTDLRGPRQDKFASRGVYPMNDLFGGLGPISARPPMKYGAIGPSPILDVYHHQVRKQRWNTFRDNDNVKRNAGAGTDFINNDSFGEVGWTHGNLHGISHAQFSERSFQNFDLEGVSSFTRYRQFLRQPRVPPPPSVNSVQRRSFGAPSGRKSSSTYIDEHTHYNHPGRSELRNMQTGYDNVQQSSFGAPLGRKSSPTYIDERTQYNHPGRSELWNMQRGYDDVSRARPLQEEVIHSENIVEKLTPRCDSQSSVSVSSPPSSPVPLSHDEMDAAGDSPKRPTSADGEKAALSDTRSTGEWGVESSKDIQDQEDYGEEDDDYQDKEATNDGEYYNLDLGQEPEDMLAGSGETEQVILGFDEGVEVTIPSNNDMEIASKHSDDKLKVHVSTSVVEELVKDVENVFPVNDADSSLAIISETQKAMRDLSLDAVTNINCSVNNAVECISSGMSVQHTTGSYINLPLASSSSVPTIFSSSSLVSQVEAPVKLQFGLFSGPTLIPPPVPPIQIGSIQMPIPMHAQINLSLPQIHPSQPPLFQFGQLRYPASLSHNVMPPCSQNLPFIQPQSPAPYSFYQNPVSSLHKQSAQDFTSQNNSRDGGYSCSAKKQVLVPDHSSQEKVNYKRLNGLTDTVNDNPAASQNKTDRLSFSQNKTTAESVCQAEHNGNNSLVTKRSFWSVSGKKDSQVPGPIEPQSSRFYHVGKAPSKSSAGLSSIRGKRYVYGPGSRPSMQESQTSIQRNRRQFRRTEFRVRENVEKKQVEPVDNAAQDEKQSTDGRILGTSMRNLSKYCSSSSRPTKMITESDNFSSGASVSLMLEYDSKVEITTGKASASQSPNFDKSHAAVGSIDISGNSWEDVDAPLQNGIVCVFKQPGIEIPNDDDDFIEVRYKRRMLNDRREQREKESKAKFRINKAPRKDHPVRPSNVSLSISQKQVERLGGDSAKGVNFNSSIVEGHVACELEKPLGFTANLISGAASAAVDTGTSSDEKLSQLMQTSRVSGGGGKLVTGLIFENNNVTAESAALGMNTWDKGNMDQQAH